MRFLAPLLLGLALLAAGCTSAPPTNPTTSPSGAGTTSPAPAANKTGSSPVVVVNKTYTYTPGAMPGPDSFQVSGTYGQIQFTGTATASVCAGASVKLRVTNPDGQTVVLDFSNPAGQNCDVKATGTLPGTAGKWNIAWGGQGSMDIHLVGVAS